jgi:hypothetical protein
MIAGTNTKMRFGVIGMGNMFHTFHIHGHRWVIPGPEGNTPGAIQGSAERVPVSQFEDTRIFGPANSFSFTIEGASGSFMRAGGSGSNDSKGEWHMHCHVLGHMTTGMMGSLLIVNAGDFAGGLQKGEADPCDPGSGMPGMGDLVITARNDPSNTAGFGYSFDQSALGPVHAGNTIRFNNPSDAPHSIIWDVVPNRPLDSAVFTTGGHVDILIPNAGIFHYTCGIHGNGMAGTITVLP